MSHITFRICVSWTGSGKKITQYRNKTRHSHGLNLCHLKMFIHGFFWTFSHALENVEYGQWFAVNCEESTMLINW